MCVVHKEDTQGIFQRENAKSHFVEQNLKQGAWDAPTDGLTAYAGAAS